MTINLINAKAYPNHQNEIIKIAKEIGFAVITPSKVGKYY